MEFVGTRKWRIFPSKKDKSVKDNHRDSPQWFYFQVFMFLFYLLSPLYQNWFPWLRDTGTNDEMCLLRLSPKRHYCGLLESSSWLMWASIWKGNQSMHKNSPNGSCQQLIRNGNKQPTSMLVSHLGKSYFFSFIQTIRQLQHWLIA